MLKQPLHCSRKKKVQEQIKESKSEKEKEREREGGGTMGPNHKCCVMNI